MNCRDDRAGIWVARGFLEEGPYRVIRKTERDSLAEQRTSEGASRFMNYPGQGPPS
jgi:hypothetical protein